MGWGRGGRTAHGAAGLRQTQPGIPPRSAPREPPALHARRSRQGPRYIAPDERSSDDRTHHARGGVSTCASVDSDAHRVAHSCGASPPRHSGRSLRLVADKAAERSCAGSPRFQAPRSAHTQPARSIDGSLLTEGGRSCACRESLLPRSIAAIRGCGRRSVPQG